MIQQTSINQEIHANKVYLKNITIEWGQLDKEDTILLNRTVFSRDNIEEASDLKG